ncbi:alpha/beta-hydrolase [Auriscalpium vulgare]|uniref:Alpha/beta-hydrolase n=1 Tax=Auriscalpium vulgare TaxID=40419 RepID=A0ACB8R567_9AGAM|nr:alpha/beta-hydrolase [Auriscalpium vulgare]
MSSEESLIIIASGRKVFAQIYKPTSTPASAIPILFIHGLMGTHDAWKHILPIFPTHTRILYDLFGHGRTPYDTPATPATLAEDARDVVAHFGFAKQKVDVVAHSGGAIAALEFAATYPGAVRNLVLLGPPAVPLPKEQMEQNIQFVKAQGLPAVLAMQKNFLGAAAKDDASIHEALAAQVGGQKLEGILAIFDAMAASQAKEVAVDKVAVFYGKEDPASGKEGAEALARRLGGEVGELPCGHWFMLEAPQLLGEELIKIIGA